MSHSPQLFSKSKAWAIIILVVLVVGLLFVAPYLGVIAIAALFAFLFFPIYRRILGKSKRTGLAAAATLIISLVVLIIPVVFVFMITVGQIATLATSISNEYAHSGATLPELFQNAIQTVNDIAAPFSGQEAVITDQGVIQFIRSVVPDIIRTATTIIVGTVGSIPLAIIMSIMYVILFLEFLIYGKKLLGLVVKISPLEPEVTTVFLQRIGAMANAMAKGQLLISFIISLLSAILLIFLGLGQYFVLMVVVFTLLNLIPLGCGILVIPIAIVAILLGNVVPGIIVLVLYILVSNLDSVIRPKIIPKSVYLSAGLTTIAAFGGLYYYGILGVIYGPIIMIVLVTAVTMYASYKTTGKELPVSPKTS